MTRTGGKCGQSKGKKRKRGHSSQVNVKGRNHFVGVDPARPHFLLLVQKVVLVESHSVETVGLKGPFREAEGRVTSTAFLSQGLSLHFWGWFLKQRASWSPLADAKLFLRFPPQEPALGPCWLPRPGGNHFTSAAPSRPCLLQVWKAPLPALASVLMATPSAPQTEAGGLFSHGFHCFSSTVMSIVPPAPPSRTFQPSPVPPPPLDPTALWFSPCVPYTCS